MTRSGVLRDLEIAFTYIGTIVGAGFASGREVYQFFGQFGNIGYIGIFVSIALFAWIGYRFMALGQKLNANSFRSLNAHLFGDSMGKFVDTIIMVMLFGVTVAMLAGAGEVFHEHLDLSFQIGVIVTIIITYFTIRNGIRGVLRANSIIVPLMIGFVLYAGIAVVSKHGFHLSVTSASMSHPHKTLFALLSSLMYAAFNVGLAGGVLLSLGANSRKASVLRRGAYLGAAGLGLMLFAVTFTLSSYPAAMDYAVPMGFIAGRIGPIFRWAFIVILWAEIYSTLVGNVYVMSAQFGGDSVKLRRRYTALVLVVSYVFCQVGFKPLITYGYTAFAWICLLIVAAVLFPPRKLPRH